MGDYRALRIEDRQARAAQILTKVQGRVLPLSNTDNSVGVPAGANGVLLYCADLDFYWQLDAAAVAGDGGGAFATKATWLNFALHPDVLAIHAILATGTANLQINFLFG